MSMYAGTWKMETNENFEDYLKAVGVGFAKRNMVKMAKPANEITIEGDTWKIKTLGMKTTEISFKLDQEFGEKTADGRDVKTTFTLSPDGKKLTQVQKGSVPSTLIRELIDDKNMVMKMEAKGVVCTRKYKKD